MKANDNCKAYGFGSLKIKKLKGHVRITLRDVVTGQVRVTEGENIVTNAISDILANPYLSCLDATKMMPLTDKWFGGLLCYHDTFATDPNNPILDSGGNPVLDGQGNPMYHPYPTDYGIPGDDVNEVMGHAGDTAPATAAIINEDLKRGAPSDIIISADSVKRTWSFEPRQAIGVISALALTHVDVGNAGTGNTSAAFQNFDPFDNLTAAALTPAPLTVTSPNNIFGQYDDNHGFWFAIGEDGEFTPTGNHTKFETNKLTVYIRRLPYAKVGLFETLLPREAYQRKFTVEFSSSFKLYVQPCYHFDYANKRLWIFSNATSASCTFDNENVKYAVIDCNEGVSDNARILTEGVISCDSEDLAPIPFQPEHSGMHYSSNLPINYNIICDGTYVWLPTVSDTIDWSDLRWSMNVDGLKKITISTPTVVDSITFNQTLGRAQGSSVKSGGLIIATGGHANDAGARCIVANNGVGYKCAATYPAVDINSNALRAFSEPYKPVTFVAGVGTHSGMTQNRYVLATKLVNTTKFNLKSAVDKKATEQMTVEYTLTEET